MTKQKKTEELAVTNVEPVETALARPDDVWEFLDKQADKDYEPGFVKIAVNHQSGTFSAAGFGTDTDISGIVLAAPAVRALWGFGNPDDEKEIKEWCGGLPICSSRNEDARVGKGTVVKPVDTEAPDSVKHLIQAIAEADYMCKEDNSEGCPWSNFGSVPGERGQACKKCVRLLVWNPESNIAGVLVVTPTSLKVWKSYKAGLPSQHYSRVVTAFTLNERGGGDRKYCTLRFTKAGDVAEDMIQPLRKQVLHKGVKTFEVKALVAEFLQLDLDKETDYPSNGKAGGDDF